MVMESETSASLQRKGPLFRCLIILVEVDRSSSRRKENNNIPNEAALAP